jgi:crossover junction endodeoxyribonuclease RuvC
VISEFQPTEAALETLYFARNVSSAIPVSEAKGVAILCLTQHVVPLAEYAPNTIKLSVTGTAAAGKESVQKYVKLLLGLSKIPEPDHAADALAVAITHINQRALG